MSDPADDARRARRAARARRVRRRRLTAIIVVLVILVVGGGAIAALAGRGDHDGAASAVTSTPTAATTTAPPDTTTTPPRPAGKPRVTVIGDSVSASLMYVPSAVRLLRTGLDLRLDLRVCRRLASLSCPYMGATPPSALDVIETRGARLGPTVAIDVGYNDVSTTYQRDVREVLGALREAGVTNVVWVSLAEKRPDYAAINAIVRSAARRDPEHLCVADWARVSRGQPYFGDDGLHLNTAGATAFAKLLRPYAIRAGRTGSCRPA
ncbi:MAG: hypothetical protein AB7O78_00655 [Thermoleophilia bacterium]